MPSTRILADPQFQQFKHTDDLIVLGALGWRSRLRGRTVTAETAAVGGSTEKEPTAGLIELGALGNSSSRCEIRLDPGGAVVPQVVRG